MPTILITFAGSACLAWLLCFPVRRELLRRQLMDHPNGRSSHQVPTPRGGGIAIMLVVSAGLIATGFVTSYPLLYVLAGAAVILAAVSWLDDLKPLSARVRFAAHSVAAMIFLYSLFRWFPVRTNPLQLGGFVVFFLWIVGYTNAFNFMDGINGISGVQACVTALGSILIVGASRESWLHPLEICAAIVAGAALGFLPHNFPRARMFMGDVGSAPLGFLLASLPLALSAEFGWSLLLPLVLLHLNYVLDTNITFFRRFLRGERVYEAHKEHFYQRLVRAGKSHTYVTCWELFLQLVTLGLLLIYPAAPPAVRFPIVGAVLAIWFAFYLYVEVVFGRSTGRTVFVQRRREVSQQTQCPG